MSRRKASLVTLPREKRETTHEQKLAWEKEYLGVYLNGHPLDDAVGLPSGLTAICAIEPETDDGSTVRIAGVASIKKHIITKSGKPMIFVAVEDRTAAIDAVVFPDLYAKTRDIWPGLVALEGRVDNGRVLQIVANRAKSIKRKEAA